MRDSSRSMSPFQNSVLRILSRPQFPDYCSCWTVIVCGFCIVKNKTTELKFHPLLDPWFCSLLLFSWDLCFGNAGCLQTSKLMSTRITLSSATWHCSATTLRHFKKRWGNIFYKEFLNSILSSKVTRKTLVRN